MKNDDATEPNENGKMKIIFVYRGLTISISSKCGLKFVICELNESSFNSNAGEGGGERSTCGAQRSLDGRYVSIYDVVMRV